jgi:phage/conjugal plasmid C-4 type zinc finger TraR family protein
MDGRTLEQIREQLLARWGRMGQTAKPQTLALEGEPIVSTEVIDIAQALEQMGRDTSLQEAERRELLAIERALAKMATGKFGVCEECDDEIPARRLMVLPEARLCAVCQAFEERQNAKINTRARLAG